MSNDISFVNVIVPKDFKQEYMIALAKEGINMKTHITNACQVLIDKHSLKKKK